MINSIYIQYCKNVKTLEFDTIKHNNKTLYLFIGYMYYITNTQQV